jgi:hypothetical protein
MEIGTPVRVDDYSRMVPGLTPDDNRPMRWRGTVVGYPLGKWGHAVDVRVSEEDFARLSERKSTPYPRAPWKLDSAYGPTPLLPVVRVDLFRACVWREDAAT